VKIGELANEAGYEPAVCVAGSCVTLRLQNQACEAVTSDDERLARILNARLLKA
jgi:pterin-4a-carbinolamine dehydratase